MAQKIYDSEEDFKIDLDMAYQVDDLHYKGVKTKYIENTNTLRFSRDIPEPNDLKKLGAIVYRNYTVEDVKIYIDYSFKKNIYDELEATLYSGYPTEDNYRKDLVEHIKKAKYSDMKDVSRELDYWLSPYDLIRLSNEYKKQDMEFNDKVEYLLVNINYFDECSKLVENKVDVLISDSKDEIKKTLENYVLTKFVTQWKNHPESSGYLSINSKELEDVSNDDCRYLQYEGYIRPTLNGYELTDEYIYKLNCNEMKIVDKVIPTNIDDATYPSSNIIYDEEIQIEKMKNVYNDGRVRVVITKEQTDSHYSVYTYGFEDSSGAGYCYGNFDVSQKEVDEIGGIENLVYETITGEQDKFTGYGIGMATGKTADELGILFDDISK